MSLRSTDKFTEYDRGYSEGMIKVIGTIVEASRAEKEAFDKNDTMSIAEKFGIAKTWMCVTKICTGLYVERIKRMLKEAKENDVETFINDYISKED